MRHGQSYSDSKKVTIVMDKNGGGEKSFFIILCNKWEKAMISSCHSVAVAMVMMMTDLYLFHSLTQSLTHLVTHPIPDPS